MERKDSIKIRVTRKVVIGEDYEIDRKIAPDLIAVNDGWGEGIIDIEGNIVVPCKYDEISDFSGGLARVQKNGLWYYYINKKGEEVIPCEFPDARDFSEGLAAVKKDGLWCYINKKGEEVIPYKYKEVGDFSEGLAAVCNNEDGLWGYINKKGEEVIPCKYESAQNFNRGVALVEVWNYRGCYGRTFIYINKKGDEAIPNPHFLYSIEENCNEVIPIARFCTSEGLACVYNEYLLRGYVNKKDKEVIPCEFHDARDFSEGLAAVKKDGLWGYINKKGKEVIPCEFYYAENFSEGLAAVRNNKDGRLWGYINKKGKEVIPCEYESAQNFNRGLACVQKNGLWYCIDKTGKTILDASMIKYDKKITEELYIENEKEIPDNCTGIEILSYKSLFILNNGDRLVIEAPTREEWENEIKKISQERMICLENSIKNTPLTKKLTYQAKKNN